MTLAWQLDDNIRVKVEKILWGHYYDAAINIKRYVCTIVEVQGPQMSHVNKSNAPSNRAAVCSLVTVDSGSIK